MELDCIPALDSLNHFEQLSQQLGLYFLTYKVGLFMRTFKLVGLHMSAHFKILLYINLLLMSIGKIRKQYPDINQVQCIV